MYELIAVALFVLVVLAFCVGYSLGMQRGLYAPGERKTPLIKKKVKLQPTGVTLHTPKEEAEIEKKLKKQEGDLEEEEEEE